MNNVVKPVICLGSFHWDEIAISSKLLARGDDSPGRIKKTAGGVAFNVAKTLTELKIPVLLGTVIGSDIEGQELINTAKGFGINCDLICNISPKTDKYLAIEDTSGLVAAVADCKSLEEQDNDLLEKVFNWIKSMDNTFEISTLVIDCNLSNHFIKNLLNSPYLKNYPIKIASASSHKIGRLKHIDFTHQYRCTTLYSNRVEAMRILAEYGLDISDVRDKFQILQEKFGRIIVTDGPNEIIDADSKDNFKVVPPALQPKRFTGAGDYFMGAHIAYELLGYSRMAALRGACNFVRGKIA